jgi:penicillin-binding protein 1A
MRRLIRLVAAFLIVAVVTPVAATGTILTSFLFLPLPANLPEPKPINQSQLSRVFDVDGNQIAIFRRFETSIPVKPSDIPEALKKAVVAAEDRNFYKHGGVDIRGTTRALWADLRNRGAVQGGSTITQQLVKNTYTGNERSLTRKVREAVLASQLDRQMSKSEILFRYLSLIYLGGGAYGVGAASETYFRKPVSQLTLSEAALLAGIIPAPSRFDPRIDPAAAELRRVDVLDKMLHDHRITQAQYDEARPQAVHLAAGGPPTGPATLVWPPEVEDSTAPYFTDYVEKWLAARLPGGRDQIYTGGLTIETTLDPKAQYLANTEVNHQLQGTDPRLEMSLVAVEPPTGFVRAMIGGRDWRTSQVNRALGAFGGGSGRQAGSAWKPVVLATAFDEGIPPTRRYSGSVLQVGRDTIKNYGGESFGTIDLRTATKHSVNTVYARLALDVGVPKVFDMAKRLGIRTEAYDPARHGASVALGVLDVSPLDMAAAYGVFAARGKRAEPSPVLRVLDRNGKVLIDNTKPKTDEVLKTEVADNLNDVLRGPLQPGGTAGRWDLDRPAAGKTGTTSDNGDAGVVGYTPTLSTAVWMGFDDRRIKLRGIKGVREVVGGTLPAESWNHFMKAALADVPKTDFNQPAPLRAVADAAQRQARRGFEPGLRRYAAGTPTGGPYVYDLPAPAASAAVTTTTSTSTTSTTIPGGGGGGPGVTVPGQRGAGGAPP